MAKVEKDSLANTFIIAVFLCLVCSIVVSSLSVSLKPMQLLNKELDQKKNILRAAGMLPCARTANESFTRTTLDKIKFIVPEQILFFNADAGSLRPSTVSIEDAGPAVTV